MRVEQQHPALDGERRAVEREQVAALHRGRRTGAALTATYSVLASGDSAGALFIATLAIGGIAGGVAADVQLPTPLASTRAMPLTSPAGFAPVTMKPKNTLPCASTVSGVLMKTLASNAAAAAAVGGGAVEDDRSQRAAAGDRRRP